MIIVDVKSEISIKRPMKGVEKVVLYTTKKAQWTVSPQGVKTRNETVDKLNNI